MLGWFRALMPKEERFFELFKRHLNQSLDEPAVTASAGGQGGGRATVTPAGERIINLYHVIED